MTEFHDHPTKRTIREQWCKPLLEHINKELGYKLIYLGLPGIKILDILAWQEYLDKVIAFDCGDYNDPPDPVISKSNLDELDENLRTLERKEILTNYSLYRGYIEKVVLRGLDENGNRFNQTDFVTVYHLDFCNSLTSPFKIFDDKGNISEHYKTEVITKLLEYERDASGKNENKKFVMFLTVHSHFFEKEAERLFDQEDSKIYKKYRVKVSKLGEQDKKIRLLKLYTFHVLKNHFCSRQFIPDFLSPIYYEGTGNHWLICFTVIGTYEKTASGSAIFNQDIAKLLYSKFLIADKDSIKPLENDNFEETNTEADPVKLFGNSETYNRHWSKR
jgi:hypothetical protein